MNPEDVEVINVEIVKLIKYEPMAGWKDKRLEKQRSSTQQCKYLFSRLRAVL